MVLTFCTNLLGHCCKGTANGPDAAIGMDSVREVDALFVDAKASAMLLQQHADKYLK